MEGEEKRSKKEESTQSAKAGWLLADAIEKICQRKVQDKIRGGGR